MEANPIEDGEYAPLIKAERDLEAQVSKYICSLTRSQRQDLANAIRLDDAPCIMETYMFDVDKEDDYYVADASGNLFAWYENTSEYGRVHFNSVPMWPSADELMDVMRKRMRAELNRFMTFVRDTANEGHIEITRCDMRVQMPWWPYP